MEKLLIIQNGATDQLRFEAGEILCIHADGNYCMMTLADGRELQLWMNLLEVTRLINEQMKDERSIFVRTGRQYILNLRYISRIDTKKDELVLWRKDIAEPVIIKTISHEALTKLSKGIKELAL
jgi:DNA-binding LytR/AlgR family response regulator